MGIAEGTIRKNGIPAKKPGYASGTKIVGNGRPRKKHCGLPGCHLKPLVPSNRPSNPNPYFCSIEHRILHQRHLTCLRYGITIEIFDTLLLSQGGVCAVCGTDDPKSPGRGGNGSGNFHIDHDHNTGKVRGLLCGQCNRGIGQLQEDPVLLRSAARYLEEAT